MNTFGSKFRVTVFGESHGAVVGVVVDGVRPGIGLAAEDFAADLGRRRSGAAGTTARREIDRAEIASGVFEGRTTGAPVTVVFRNEDARHGDYGMFRDHPRPSHADYVANVKCHGFNDIRGGGQFSGRMTLALVAAGVIAKKMLPERVVISSRIAEIGGCHDVARFGEVVADAAAEGDSVGGIVECAVSGLPVGLGEPFFDSVESVAAHLLFSIPGIKGVEFGAGFEAARMRGSQHNDRIISPDGTTATNNSGGVTGGITNGNQLVVRVAVKPTPSISGEQHSFNFRTGRVEPLSIGGRHDACIALRVPVVVEAAVAIALAQF